MKWKCQNFHCRYWRKETQKSQGSGNAGVEVLCEVRRSTRGLCFMGKDRGHMSLTKATRMALVKGAAMSLRISVLALLCISGLTVGEAITNLNSLIALGF